jgi:hypothetical protein
VNSKKLFFTTTINADTYKDLVSKDFVGYRQYLVDANNCRCALS